jgi:acyl-CoA thioesterase
MAPVSQGEKIRIRIDSFNRSEMARLLGMVCTAGRPGYARMEMDTVGKRGPGGVAHGGAIFTLADHAFGLAANLEDHRQVALSAHIAYLAPATGHLVAIAERVAENEANSIYRVSVSEGDRIVAFFEGVGIRVPPRPHDQAIGNPDMSE